MTTDLRGKCPDYRPWKDMPQPLNIAECYWFIGSTRYCDAPMSRYHNQDCPWEGYAEGKPTKLEVPIGKPAT